MGDLNIAHGGEGWEQVEFLEDEADAVLAQAGALGIAEGGKVDAVDDYAASGGLGESAEEVKERGLARPRGPDDGDELSGLNRQRDAADRGYLQPACRVNLGQVFGKDDGRRRGSGHVFHCKCDAGPATPIE